MVLSLMDLQENTARMILCMDGIYAVSFLTHVEYGDVAMTKIKPTEMLP